MYPEDMAMHLPTDHFSHPYLQSFKIKWGTQCVMTTAAANAAKFKTTFLKLYKIRIIESS